MSPGSLVLHELRFEQRSWWRNTPSVVFTFVFPVMFLVLLGSVNSGSRVDWLGGIKYDQYFGPAIIAFGIISASYTNLAMTLSIRRDRGTLKRLRGTPLPTPVYLSGLVANSLVVAVVIAALTAAIAMIFFGVTFPGRYVALVLAVVVGTACFCSLGIAMATLIPNADAAPAVVNGILFPILFISGIFYPVDPHSALGHLGAVFPVRHFALAVFAAFDPRGPHGFVTGIPWVHLAVLAGWTVVGAAVALRRFRWEPARR